MWEGNANAYILFTCCFPDCSKLQYASHPVLVNENFTIGLTFCLYTFKKITAIKQKILWGDFRSLEMQALGNTRLREYCEVGVSWW